MDNEYKNVEMKISRDIANRINELMSIEDFEENPELLKDLGFDVDSLVFRKSVTVDSNTIELSVYTGQTNAWIEVVSIDADNNVGEGDPIFDIIEGEYYTDIYSGKESYVLHVSVED